MKQQKPTTGTLYVVATPIGNLEDITVRAMRLFSTVSVIGCENVVRTKSLFDSLRIDAKDKKFIVLNDAGEDRATAQILTLLNSAHDVVIVSDAGTPLISDPGFQLIREANAVEIGTVPVPGSSAITTLASVCPIPLNEYRFIAFLPKKGRRRRERLTQIQAADTPTVMFESPHRVLHTLEDMLALDLGARNVFLGREMTKRFEEYIFTTLQELHEEFLSRSNVKGELAMVIDRNSQPQSDLSDQRLQKVLLQYLKPGQVASIIAELTELSRDEAYATIVQFSEVSGRS